MNKFRQALEGAQALLNPASGFLKKLSPKHEKYVEETRQHIRDCLLEIEATE